MWTTGDATVAYQTEQPPGRVKRVTRDLVFVDQRYVITRDRVELSNPGVLSWLLQAERSNGWDNQSNTSWIRGDKASLTTRVVSPGIDWFASITDRYPAPIDPRYASGETYDWVTAKWREHVTLRLESKAPAPSFTVIAVLWPERDGLPAAPLDARMSGDGTLVVQRPDGRTDRVVLTDRTLVIQ